jgi:ATP-binding cassette subfamily F protein 3
MLAKLLVTPANLLLLDEPTHHLDMESCDALLAALVDFAGTVVMVTHNEMFLNALADRLIVFQNGSVEVFDGGYAEFLENGGWRDETAGGKSALTDDGKAEASKLTKKDKRRLRSEIIAQRSRAIKKIETRITVLEKEIAAGEERLNNLNAEMLQVSQAQDGPRIETLSKSLHACRSAVDKLYVELEKQSANYDEQRAEFDGRLEKIDKM